MAKVSFRQLPEWSAENRVEIKRTDLKADT
jgi:hypothetical protein